MENKNERHQRRSIRLKEYDYSSAGAYFITAVSHQRLNIFGSIRQEIMNLNPIGKIIDNAWLEIPNHFPYVTLDAYVIMPNHLHGILQIKSGGVRLSSPLHTAPIRMSPQPIKRQPLGMIVGSFKSAVTKHVHQAGFLTQQPIWQRNYFEHVIRDDEDYERIIEYIKVNPLNWDLDNENLEKLSPV
jgi:REP element-mobilizing transposase RayT